MTELRERRTSGRITFDHDKDIQLQLELQGRVISVEVHDFSKAGMQLRVPLEHQERFIPGMHLRNSLIALPNGSECSFPLLTVLECMPANGCPSLVRAKHQR